MSEIRSLVIGNRNWHVGTDDMSEAHETWIRERAQLANLFSYDLTKETIDQFFQRIMHENQKQPQALFEVLAAVVLPLELNNSDWTPAVSEANALFFVGLINERSQEDTEKITRGLLMIVQDSVGIKLTQMASEMQWPN